MQGPNDRNIGLVVNAAPPAEDCDVRLWGSQHMQNVGKMGLPHELQIRTVEHEHRIQNDGAAEQHDGPLAVHGPSLPRQERRRWLSVRGS